MSFIQKVNYLSRDGITKFTLNTTWGKSYMNIEYYRELSTPKMRRITNTRQASFMITIP